MANRIDIIADGVSLDLHPNTEKDFYVTLIMYDLSNLETRNGTYTKQIKLPSTPKNYTFFGVKMPFVGGRPPNAYRRVNVEILIDGIPIQKDLEGLYIGIEEDSYLFQIFGSAASFYDQLSDNLISDLDLSEVDFNMTVANVNTRMTTTDNKLVTPFLDYLTFDSGVDIGIDLLWANANFLKDYNIRFSGFTLYVKWLIQKIIEAIGYEADFSAISNTTFENLVMIIPVFQFVELPSATLAVGNYRKGNTQIISNQPTPIRVSFITLLTAPVGSTWSGAALYQYAFTASAIVDITLKLDYTYTYSAARVGPTWVGIFKNTGALLYRYFTAIDAGSRTETLQALSVQVNPGDVIYVQCVVAQKGGGGIADILQINTLSEFGYLEQSSSNTQITVNQWVPEIEQKNFLINIIRIFNFVINVNPITKAVIFTDFDDIFTSVPEDLSEYIDDSIEPKISTQFGPLAINSRFKWSRDSDIIREDGDGLYVSENTTLPADATIIDLDAFSISDQSEFAPTRNGTLKIRHPSFSMKSIGVQGKVSAPGAGVAFNITDANGVAVKGGDFRTGDYLVIPAIPRVYYINTLSSSNSAGTVIEAFTAGFTRTDYQIWRHETGNTNITPRLAVLETQTTSRYIHDGKDQSTTVTVASGYEARFTNEIDFESLKDTYYIKVLNMLDRVVRIQIWAYLPTFIIYNISLTRKVYIRKYDSYFYVNKIEQWKPTGKTRLDLILMTKDYNI